ncbi:MAG: putative beta-lactamase-inhibitor-like, PepSY-like [Mucilaginibacter sp.]|nr:putative beta-lactamase-inhibitor-like, PepSY-like [Mucilaginibacter sp.]
MKFIYFMLLVLGTVGCLSSCKKNSASKSADATSTSSTSTAATSTGAIAVSLASGTTDSLYMVGCYGRHDKKDTVAFSALPTAIGTYLTANYSGYSFKKAYTITDSLKAVVNYIVTIKYNSNYIGLKFTATGTFVSVLEQRTGPDLIGKGWHFGGPFDNRDGKHRDTIALSALPTAVTSYFSTNYPTDTLLHASIAIDSTYILISKNNGLFATAIKANGTFVKRIQIDKHVGYKLTAVTEANLLANITTYLTTTYPGYVFDKAYSLSLNGTVKAYAVLITSNSTKYAVVFNANGTFVATFAVH